MARRCRHFNAGADLLGFRSSAQPTNCGCQWTSCARIGWAVGNCPSVRPVQIDDSTSGCIWPFRKWRCCERCSWSTGSWGSCNGGQQSRRVDCIGFTSSSRYSDSSCSFPPPPAVRSCTLHASPSLPPVSFPPVTLPPGTLPDVSRPVVQVPISIPMSSARTATKSLHIDFWLLWAVILYLP